MPPTRCGHDPYVDMQLLHVGQRQQRRTVPPMRRAHRKAPGSWSLERGHDQRAEPAFAGCPQGTEMTRPSFCKLDPCRYAACDCESSSEQKAAGEFLRRKALESERANGHKEKHSEGTPRTDALLRGINEGRRPHQQYVVPAEIEELARQLERELRSEER